MTVQTVEWSGGQFTSQAVRDYIASLAQGINDAGLSDSSTWSSQRIDSYVRGLVSELDPGSFDAQEIGLRPHAAGDGTTDDTEAVQNALNAAATSPKQRTVVLDASKTYALREVLVPADVTLNGRGAWVKNIAGTPGSPVTLNGDRAAVVNLRVDGQADKETSQRVAGIGVRAFRDCRVERCSVGNTGWHGIVAVNPTGFKAVDNITEDTGLWQLPGSSQKIGYGICLTSSGPTAFSVDCILWGNTVRSSDDGGVGFDGHSRNCIIANNTVRDNSGDGVTGYSHRHEGMVVIGNSFENTGNTGIHIAGRDLVVAGNRSYRATTTAISIATRIPEVPAGEDPNSYNATIIGNVVTDCGMYGIRAERTIGGTVSGNTVKGAGRGAGSSYPGPYPTMQLSSSESFAVSGNYLDGLGVASRGIDMPAATGVTITGNIIQNVSVGVLGNPYTNVGTSTAITVLGNTFKNMSTGVQSVGTSTGWDVAHNTYQNVTTKTSLAGTNNVGDAGGGTSSGVTEARVREIIAEMTGGTTDTTTVAAPSTVTTSAVTATSVTVAWSAVTGASHMEVSVDGKNWQPAGTGAAGNVSITGLVPGTSYTPRVRAVGLNGTRSTIKTGSAFTTSAGTAPTPVTGTTVNVSQGFTIAARAAFPGGNWSPIALLDSGTVGVIALSSANTDTIVRVAGTEMTQQYRRTLANGTTSTYVLSFDATTGRRFLMIDGTIVQESISPGTPGTTANIVTGGITAWGQTTHPVIWSKVYAKALSTAEAAAL